MTVPDHKNKPKRNKTKTVPGKLASQQGEASNLPGRHRIGSIWLVIFQASTIFGIIALTVLLTKIINDSFGYAIIVFKTDPATLV